MGKMREPMLKEGRWRAKKFPKMALTVPIRFKSDAQVRYNLRLLEVSYRFRILTDWGWYE